MSMGDTNAALQVSLLQGVDLTDKELKFAFTDGKNKLDPPYEEPTVENK